MFLLYSIVTGRKKTTPLESFNTWYRLYLYYCFFQPVENNFVWHKSRFILNAKLWYLRGWSKLSTGSHTYIKVGIDCVALLLAWRRRLFLDLNTIRIGFKFIGWILSYTICNHFISHVQVTLFVVKIRRKQRFGTIFTWVYLCSPRTAFHVHYANWENVW